MLNYEYENFVTNHIEARTDCISIKPRAKCRVLWESKAVTEKRDTMKNVFLLNKRNPTNVNMQKLEKAQSELEHTKKNN